MSRTSGTIFIQAVGEELRLCRVRGGRTLPELSETVVIRAAQQGEDVSALRDDVAIRTLFDTMRRQRWTGLNAVCLLGGASVSSQYYELPPLKGAALRQAVELKLGQQLHFSVADAIIAFDKRKSVADETTGQIHMGATAVTRELARSAVKAIRDAGLNLVALSAASSALTTLAREVAEHKSGFASTLYIDERLSTLIVLKEGIPVVTTDIAFGAADLTAALMRPIIVGDEVIQLDADQAIALRNQVGIPGAQQQIDSIHVTGERILPLLEPVLQKLAKQLVQWLTFAGAKTASVPVSLALVGAGGATPGLAETLGERLSIKTTRADWLEDKAVAAAGTDASMLAGFSAAIGAYRHPASLPDLLPAETRRHMQIHRIRRSTIISAPVVAAVVGVFGLLFARVTLQVQPALEDHQRRLQSMQDYLIKAGQADALRQSAEGLDRQLNQFDHYSPLWVGVFKEMSNLLPPELQATQFAARGVEGQTRLILTGDVYRTEQSPGFDKIVEQTLIMLDHSPFCTNVRLVSANRREGAKAAGLAGTLSVEVALAHPREPARKLP